MRESHSAGTFSRLNVSAGVYMCVCVCVACAHTRGMCATTLLRGFIREGARRPALNNTLALIVIIKEPALHFLVVYRVSAPPTERVLETRRGSAGRLTRCRRKNIEAIRLISEAGFQPALRSIGDDFSRGNETNETWPTRRVLRPEEDTSASVSSGSSGVKRARVSL